MLKRLIPSLFVVCLAGSACSSPPEPTAASVVPKEVEEPLPPVASPFDAMPEETRSIVDKPFTGDFDEMVKRRLIRAGVTINRTHYFIDHGVQRGLAYDSLMLFEKELNERLKTGNLKVHLLIVPLSRDELIPALTSGKVDLLAATLTVTPEREKVMAFSDPTRTNVAEVVVTGAAGPEVKTADDLSGREVFVRKTSSYYESLVSLNASLEKRGKPPVTIKDAPEQLEDDDILEMVNAGLVPVTVVDDYKAELWSKVFKTLRIQPAAVRTGGNIAVAMRKENPKLRQAANIWIKKYGPNTAFASQLERKYLESTKYVVNATSAEERKKFETIVGLFRKYGEQYGIDAVLMAAQGYQESRLDQNARSPVGAIGVMQIMPATGKDLGVGDITQMEPNIHGGIKYMKFMTDEYFKGEQVDSLNKVLMAFAAYNCGPGRLRQLRREAQKRGLNPNVWFGNVEHVASEKIGRETVTYVSNIYKYYVAYRLVLDQRTAKGS